MCVSVDDCVLGVCVHVCRVECGTVSMLKHGVVTLPSHITHICTLTLLTHTPHICTLTPFHSHTHAHSPPGGQVSSSATAEASAYRGRGGHLTWESLNSIGPDDSSRELPIAAVSLAAVS